MDLFKSVLSPLLGSGGALPDTLKLVVIGGTVETARRVSASAWNGFVDSFFLTAHFSQDDYPYDWLMHWLSKQPAWGRSREFDITTRSAGRLASTSTGDLEDDDEDELHGRKKRKVAFLPSMDTSHTIYYRGHWLRITRAKRFQDYGHCAELKISVVARNNDILKKLVLEAKRQYEKDAEHRVHIFMADTTYGGWRYSGSRQKRPMSSIVLEPGVKEMIVEDCKDFLRSEDWYAERGEPFRRGYLLHGVPGSGKTSLIHSLAGELGLDIYVVSLSGKGMSDNMLTTLMGHVPSRCIVLLEDLDAAFTRSVSRDNGSTGAPPAASSSSTETNAKNTETNDGSTLSLSGLLNSLDGVAAAEGRLLFATTNHIERLDPALSRPGRMDVWINFKHATKWQAEGIFKCFFPTKSSSVSRSDSCSSSLECSPTTPQDPSQQNIPVPKRKSAHSIPLLDDDELSELARKFGEAIPEDEFSVASLQGYLLRNKSRPRECVDEVQTWIQSERETKARLKKEKEEVSSLPSSHYGADHHIQAEKKEAEEKAKREKEEKAAKEKEEREAKEAKEREEKEKEKTEKKESRPRLKKSSRGELHKIDTSMSKPAPPAELPAPKPQPVNQATTSGSSSSSEAESSSNTGNEGDEESVTSEEEYISNLVNASTESKECDTKTKEKWVSVKGESTPEAVPAAAAA
ncbi:P-loop containing nucleoside triphosphate hydrolase protein [Punctularia strigosozonata HHB-11173 SS5]|uniref:P-loop containing nucleoside triphosphate hydrolase protein n=1 Tax=Punctularia strigosozonata (strain HHB-11173) TaxID=741275 RepID=UPI0004417981|nr:P-loop containing nucleoside triphosphate hydrolase protein [Punctularia strigosozonata HHB-11173 SS5]EIN06198.1 P-loop containing nucleoside triphosphate hydrolase protein [Punctularia strigosozonata HHB-11173 SS5]